MLNIFRRFWPYNSFLLVLLGLMLLSPILFNNTHIEQYTSDGIIWVYITKSGVFRDILSRWLMLILLIGMGIYINQLVIHYKLFQKSNYLTGMCWMIIVSFFIKEYHFSSLWFILILVLVITSKLLSLFGSSQLKGDLFNIGMLYGISVLIYSPSIHLALYIGVMLLLVRPVYISEWLMVFIGAITPYYIVASILFLNDHSLTEILPKLLFKYPYFDSNNKFIISCTLILIPSLIGLVYVLQNMRKYLVHTREAWSAIFLFSLCVILILFFAPKVGSNIFLFLFVPASILGASFYNYVKIRYLPAIILGFCFFWGIYCAYS